MKNKKVAIITDWLTSYGGAEKVVLAVSEIFPESPIFTAHYSKKNVGWFKDCDIRTGWVNLFPSRFRKILGPLRILYFSKLDLSEFDVIISICCAESKGIKTNKEQLHISYLQGPPIQYYWGMFDEYVKNPGFGRLNSIVRFFFKLFVNKLRKKDFEFSQRPDFIVANSSYCKDEILKYYNRDSQVIFPPVEISKFKLNNQKEDFYISTSRQVNWKRLDLAVNVFKKNGLRLKLVGDGSEHQKLIEISGNASNIEFISPIADSDELAYLVSRAKGFIFPSLEPFGIAPIESLACGTPVIAFSRGGSRDYIIDGENGIFFDNQTVESLEYAIKKFEKIKFNSDNVSKTAKEFGVESFKNNFKYFVEGKINEK